MPEEKPQAVKGEYMGSPTLTIFINNSDKYRFSFGLGKAKAILSYFEDIKKFVEENDKPTETKKEG